MKSIITILLISTILSCKAQSIIVPIGSGDNYELNSNYYLKDINNEFEKFTGEWKYQNGTTEIIFKLKKEVHYQISSDSDYEDLLVGEYQYVENGVEKTNSLSDFDNTNITGYDHKISGGVFLYILPSYCIDNSENQEIKVELFIQDPNNDDIEGEVVLRYVNDNGIEKLQACIRDKSALASDVNARIDIPDGYYEFIKQ